MSEDSQQEIDALIRFINQVSAEGLDADALEAGLRATGLRITELQNKSPGRKKRPPVTIDQPAFGVAMALERGEITYTEAVIEIQEMTFKGPRTAEQLLKDMRPRAREVNALEDFMNRALNRN